ncbi:glycosyltransferase family 4 protein [Occallatibacter savannae]|uniref:glycosyltransferase family 4 protein n=1 Tax=Occallatibacter savannae TaxID=1002691 RepID=UPI000D69EA0D|nr:glycosyltransferase family 4 protein [Occallatibacter savannae]
MQEEVPLKKVALFTGGIDRHYASGLWGSLAGMGVQVDVICNAEMKDNGASVQSNLDFLTLYASPKAGRGKIAKLLTFLQVYWRLMMYAATTPAKVFHILWNYRIPLFDRTILLLYYKLLGKRVVFTAHNINAAERDGSDSFLNRLSLRFQYRNVDQIFVHTELMKRQLIESFGVRERNVCVIPFGTYDVVPATALSSREAKRSLGLKPEEKAILFFGRIAPYKGVDLLVDAFQRVSRNDARYRLIIAGEPMKDAETQWRAIQSVIESSDVKDRVVQHAKFIEDNEIEVYLKAADVLVLPYTQIFQSGVLFMSYSFGLPVIATNVGSFSDDIVEGETGFICRPADAEDLARSIELYFSSELYRNLDERRGKIRSFVQASHSWDKAALLTVQVYERLTRSKELEYST